MDRKGGKKMEFFFENNTILMKNRKNIGRLGEITCLASCRTTVVRQAPVELQGSWSKKKKYCYMNQQEHVELTKFDGVV